MQPGLASSSWAASRANEIKRRDAEFVQDDMFIYLKQGKVDVKMFLAS